MSKQKNDTRIQPSKQVRTLKVGDRIEIRRQWRDSGSLAFQSLLLIGALLVAFAAWMYRVTNRTTDWIPFAITDTS